MQKTKNSATEHTTPDQMLDELAAHIKSVLHDGGINTNPASIAPLLEIYFRYSTDRDIIPRYHWREKSDK